MPPEKRSGGHRLSHRLNSKCIQLEQQVASGRKRQRPPSECHVVAASAALSRMHVKDPDVSSSLIPFLQNHLCDSPCSLHSDPPETCKRIFWLSLDLSENSIGNTGISALVTWLLAKLDIIRLRSLKLYRNSVGNDGAVRLAELIKASPWPVEEIHLSHNHLGDVGVEILMKAFIEARRPSSREEVPAPNAKSGGDFVYPRLDPQRSLLLPVWIRLEYNYVTQVVALLDRVETAFHEARGSSAAVACFAEKSGMCVKDPNCSPKRCAKASANFGPLFHLYSFTHQMRPLAKPPAADSPPPRRLSPLGLANSEPCDAATLSRGATERRHSAAEIYPDSSQHQDPFFTSAPLYIFPDIPTCLALTKNLCWPVCWSSLLSSRVSCDDLVFCLSNMSCEALKECVDFGVFTTLIEAGLVRMADELPAAEEFFSRAVDLDQMLSASFPKSAADVIRTVMALSVPAEAPVVLLVEESALVSVRQLLTNFGAPRPPIAVMTAADLNQDLIEGGVNRRTLQSVVQRHCVSLAHTGTPEKRTARTNQDQLRTPTATLSRSLTDEIKQADLTRTNEQHHAPRYESYIANLTRDMLDETVASINELQRVNDQLVAWRRGSERSQAPSAEASADACLATLQQLLNRWDLLRSRLATAAVPYAPAGSSASEATAAETHVCAHEGMLTTQSPAYFTQLVSRLNSLIDSKF